MNDEKRVYGHGETIADLETKINFLEARINTFYQLISALEQRIKLLESTKQYPYNTPQIPGYPIGVSPTSVGCPCPVGAEQK